MINLSLDELKIVAKDETLEATKTSLKILSEQKPKISIFKKKIKEMERGFDE